MLRIESRSVQREGTVRLRGSSQPFTLSLQEFIERYEKLERLTSNLNYNQRITVSESLYLMRFPKSTLNFMNGKKLHIEELSSLKKQLET